MAKTRSTPRRAYSKLSVKSQTVLPREVREALRVGPGDRLRYVLDETGVRLEKASEQEVGDDPFLSFAEWASEQDDKAYGNL